jgi:hypothetical protein
MSVESELKILRERQERFELQIGRLLGLVFRSFYGTHPGPSVSALTSDQRDELLEFIKNNVEYGEPLYK